MMLESAILVPESHPEYADSPPIFGCRSGWRAEGAGVLPALSRGWEIFRDNLGPILVMAIILAVIGLVAGFVIAIPILIVVVPFTFAFVAGNLAGNGPNWNAMFAALACMCLLSPVLWLLRGVLVAYIESAWTLTYMRLTKPQDSAPVIIEANA